MRNTLVEDIKILVLEDGRALATWGKWVLARRDRGRRLVTVSPDAPPAILDAAKRMLDAQPTAGPTGRHRT